MKRLCSIFLIICITASMLPLSMLALNENMTANSQSLSLSLQADTSLYDNEIRKLGGYTLDELKNATLSDDDIPELVNRATLNENGAVKRLKSGEDSLNSVLYQNSDGTFSKIIYNENIKYTDINGNVVDKSNKIRYVPTENKYYNPYNDVRTELPNEINNNNTIEVSYGENSIRLLPLGNNSTQTNVYENAVEYIGVFGTGTVLKYTVMYSGVKEDIILSSMPTNNSFTFEILSSDLNPEQYGNKFVFKNSDNEETAYIGELCIYDSNGNTGDGNASITQRDGKTYYTVEVSESFLASATYPVTVDPTLTYNSTAAVKDVGITNASTTATPSATRILLGTQNGYEYAAAMKFPSAYQYLQRTNVGDIVEAKVYVFKASTFIGCTLKAYRIKTSWSETSTTMQSTLLNSSNYATDGDPSITVAANTVDTIGVDVTRIFRKWKNGTADYYGLLIKNSGGECISICSSEASSMQPYLVLKINSLATLPTTEAENITSKSIYKIGNNPYLTNDNGTPKMLSASTTTGSTKTNSRFVNVNYVSGGKYTLSFSYDENESYYLKATSESTVGLYKASNTASLPDNCKWYLAYSSLTLMYNIVNAAYPYTKLGVSDSTLSLGNNDSYFVFTRIGLDVPIITQETNDYCGPASTLQIIKYFGTESAIAGYSSVTGSYQAMLYPNLLDGSEVYVYKIRNELNKSNYSSPCNYAYYNNLSNVDTMVAYIKSSIDRGCPVILHSKTQHLSYYSNVNYWHFICLVGYDTYNNVFIVRDCNNQKNGIYNGEFTVSYQDVYNATINVGRYIICAEYAS